MLKLIAAGTRAYPRLQFAPSERSRSSEVVSGPPRLCAHSAWSKATTPARNSPVAARSMAVCAGDVTRCPRHSTRSTLSIPVRAAEVSTARTENDSATPRTAARSENSSAKRETAARSEKQQRELPADGQSLALFVACRRLPPDQRALVELAHRGRARVGERRPHARGDHVEQVLDARPQRVEVDLRR